MVNLNRGYGLTPRPSLQQVRLTHKWGIFVMNYLPCGHG